MRGDMKLWQAIGVTIIIVLGFVLVLMWVNSVELEQEREETWQILERRQQHQADELYRFKQERKWDQQRLEDERRDTLSRQWRDEALRDRSR